MACAARSGSFVDDSRGLALNTITTSPGNGAPTTSSTSTTTTTCVVLEGMDGEGSGSLPAAVSRCGHEHANWRRGRDDENDGATTPGSCESLGRDLEHFDELAARTGLVSRDATDGLLVNGLILGSLEKSA